ncbi:MAG: DMT family transporter [Pyrobaculum sp.]
MFFIFAAALLWSTIGVVAALVKDVVWLAFFRSLAAALLAAGLGARLWRAAAVPGVLLAGLFTVYPAAAVYAGLGTAAYLLYTAPLWTAAALFIQGERPTRWEAAGVGLVLAAVVLMIYASTAGEVSPVGLAAGLASGVFYGLYIAAARRLSARGAEREASLGALLYTPVAVAPLAFIHWVGGGRPGLVEAAGGVYLALFATVLPYYLFAKALKETRGARAAVAASVEPALAAAWGFLIFGQVPGVYTLVAYLLITLAVLISTKRF